MQAYGMRCCVLFFLKVHELYHLRPTEQDAKKNTKFCAFLYYNCAVTYRQKFYDLLSTYKQVDALGKCNYHKEWTTGYHGNNDPRYRGRNGYDTSIEIQSGYKFVIAFENSVLDGYLSEKIVNAFLAKSIPIYFGHKTTVLEVFNKDAFIDCSIEPEHARVPMNSQAPRDHYRSQQYAMEHAGYDPKEQLPQFGLKVGITDVPEDHFRQCIEKVRELDRDDRAYAEMLMQPKFVNGEVPFPITFERAGREVARVLGRAGRPPNHAHEPRNGDEL
mmetsp:Transcript_12125/g.44255  ORF Transcript_12125/g.44255 Transcript_12125/m.44255 type:complete len:274 (+) Transcript_12125:802-1623(+)